MLGGICRKKAIEQASKNKMSFLLRKQDKTRAKLDFFINSKVKKDYFNKNSLDHKFNNKDLKKFLKSVCNIDCTSKNHDIDRSNEKFFKILNNKSIAIVGPAETDQKNAHEIDSFDVVVRLNYTFLGKNLDKIHKGLKTDVSYINGEQTDYLIKNNNGKLPDDIKIACVKDNETKRIDFLKKVNPNKYIKRITNYNMFTFNSSLSFLPLVLLDIMESEFKNIKIFHSDMFLTINRSPGYYPKEFNLGQKINLKSFLFHDPLSQHEILKKMYLNEKIKGDERFNSVMKLDKFEYLKKLEETYREK